MKIFEQAKDLHVRNIVVYGNEDKNLFYEASCENQVIEADLQDAFLKGCLLIKDGDNLFVPVSINANKVSVVASGASLVEYSAKIVEDAE